MQKKPYPLSMYVFFALSLGAFFLDWYWISLSLLLLSLLLGGNRLAYFGTGKAARWIHWIHALVFEAICMVGIVILYKARRKWAPKPRGAGTPILLVHGYLHNSSAWIFLKPFLEKRGFGPIYLINLGKPFLPMLEYAKKVKAKAEEIEKETKNPHLILIGHSMGGIVSSLYAARLAPLGKVTDVITIASPLQGTKMARFAAGANGKEMRRGALILQELMQEIRSAHLIRFYHIATKADLLVRPYSSALTEMHPGRQYVLEDIGHNSLLYSPRVGKKIAAWLSI